jgi:hypothetical protein
VTGHPKPAPPPAAKPQVWFPDTSALITLAVHLPLHEVTVDALADKKRVLLVAVVAELEELTRLSQPLASWANTALGQLGWLGDPVVLDSPSGTNLASEIQQDLAAGRTLRHDLEHWGESAIISLASRAIHLRPFMLSDDYDARIAAHARGVEAMSVHKLLQHRVVAQFGARRCRAGRLRLRGPFDEADQDVVGVTVEVAAGSVIPRRHPRVAVSRSDLNVTQGDTCVQACGDEGMPQRMRAEVLLGRSR